MQTDEEIKFKFYIGSDKKGMFKPKSNREIEYNKWFKFIDASELDFTVYYTDAPIAISGKMPIDGVKCITPTLPQTFPEAFILYRAISSNQIEITVSEINDGKKTP